MNMEEREYDKVLLDEATTIFKKVKSEISKVIVGQDEIIDGLFISILSEGHALLEGFPGLGKTMLVRSIADAFDLQFSRIQCTPDLLPADIIGTYILDVDPVTGKKTFRFEPGPIFANVILADEINRATPKTQSALLECMQERQATIGTQTVPMDRPFFVLATQNPLEMEGTYPLPEAQMDRFLMKLNVEYPKPEEELKIIDRFTTINETRISKSMSKDVLLRLQKMVRLVPVARETKEMVVDIVNATRPDSKNAKTVTKKFVEYGASPRASIGLILAAKARALLYGAKFVRKEDIIAVAKPVLRHRIILNFQGEAEGIKVDGIIDDIIKGVS